MIETLDSIEQTLKTTLNPRQLEVLDLSHQHRHHKQAPKGQGHYHIRISNECFDTSNRIMQHRKIYAILAPLINTKIHALKITVLD